jgi:hypothetical protein
VAVWDRLASARTRRWAGVRREKPGAHGLARLAWRPCQQVLSDACPLGRCVRARAAAGCDAGRAGVDEKKNRGATTVPTCQRDEHGRDERGGWSWAAFVERHEGRGVGLFSG